MGDDDKISNIENPDVRLFIDDTMILAVDEAKTSTYDFEEEYEKTRKNKSNMVSILLISTIVVVTLFVVAFSIFIDKKDDEVSVRVDAFEDLNLQKLLDELEVIDTKIQDRNREKDMLTKNYEYALSTLELNREAEFFTITSMNLDPDVLDNEKNRIRKFYNAKITRITDEYNDAVAIIDEDSSILQAEYDSLYDPTVFDTELAKSNSQKAIFDLEKQTIIDDFNSELDILRQKMIAQQLGQLDAQKKAVSDVSEKYQYEISLLDPKVEDELVNSLVVRALETELIIPDFADLRKNKFITKEELLFLDEAEEVFTAYDLISAYLTIIPHENSIKDYSRALQNINAFSAAQYNALFLVMMEKKRLAKDQFENLKAEYNSYRDMIKQELSENQERIRESKRRSEEYLAFIFAERPGDGFVMNVANKDTILLFISPATQKLFAEAQLIYIFSDISKKLLGKGIVTRRSENYYLKVDDILLAQKITINDVISLRPTLLLLPPRE